jgi:hypothetical protein
MNKEIRECFESARKDEEKENKTAVDEREEARYGSSIKIKEVEKRYDKMIELCKRAISQAQDIALSDKKFEVPKELIN